MNNLIKKGGQLTAFFIALFLCPSGLFAQDIRLMFYNAENLFDTINDPVTFDEDFTPDGKLKYNTKRYQTKQENIARVVNSTFEDQGPQLLGMCEIENRRVLEDLLSRLNLTKHQIIHFDSPDGRGIDNALLLDLEIFEVKESGVRNIDLGKKQRPTRDILWAHLVIRSTGEDIFVTVNHWPSRYGGAEESNWKRVKASDALVELTTEIIETVPNAYIVHMGDFNDHPDNESLMNVVDCKTGPCMTNLCTPFIDTDNGSHVYRGEWGILDQFVVNQNLIEAKMKYSTSSEDLIFYKKDWMLYTSKASGQKYPSRTYSGPKYYGGFSDHLPILLTLKHQE